MVVQEEKRKEMEEVIFGSGEITEQLVLINFDEYLLKYIDVDDSATKILPISEEDIPFFKKLTVMASENGKASGYVRILASTNEYRNCYIILEAPSSIGSFNMYPFKIVDLEHAEKEFPRLLNILISIYKMFEADGIYMFQHDLKTNTTSISSFSGGKRNTVEDPDCDEAGRTLVQIITEIGANVERFQETIFVNGKNYVFEGTVIYDNLVQSKLIATLKIKNHADVHENGLIYRDLGKQYDFFTGLYNKVSGLGYAKEAIQSKKYNQIVMLMIDIDNFKSVNDTYGHAFGDEVIQKFSIILKDLVRGRGIAARFGGDEFFVVLHDVGDEGAVRSVCETIASKFAWAYADKIEEGSKMTCTIGLSEYPRNGDNFDILYKKADKALYIGKQKGRHRYIIYKEAIHGEYVEGENQEKLTVSRITSGTGSAEIIKAVTAASEMLWRDGIAGLNAALSNLLPVLGINGITIYGGKKLQAERHIGNYVNPPQSMIFITDPEVLAAFNEGGWYKVNLSSRNTVLREGLFDYLKEHDIMTTYQYIIGTKDDIRGLVTFDINTKSRETSVSWSDDVVRYMVFFVQLLGIIIK